MQSDEAKILRSTYNILSRPIHTKISDSSIENAIYQHGKLVRPLLVITIARALKSTLDEIIYKFSGIIECIHCASLIKDDFLDSDEKRRNKQSAHEKRGSAYAMMMSDYIFCSALRAVNKITRNNNLLRKSVRCICSMIEAEAISYNNNSLGINCAPSKTLQIAAMKTGSLFALSSVGCGILLNLEKHKREALYNFGINIGVAFQLQNDLEEYFGAKSLSYDLSSDFKNGIATYPLSLLVKKMEYEERSVFESKFSNSNSRSILFNDVIHKMREKKIQNLVQNKIDKLLGRSYSYLVNSGFDHCFVSEISTWANKAFKNANYAI